MAARGSRRRLSNGATAFQSFEVGEGLEKQAPDGDGAGEEGHRLKRKIKIQK